MQQNKKRKQKQKTGKKRRINSGANNGGKRE
jgi:hypothetical protein